MKIIFIKNKINKRKKMDSFKRLQTITKSFSNKYYDDLTLLFNSPLIKKALRDDIHKPLGRWNIDYCTNQINRKIDFANEDHCGPCGQYKYNDNNSQNLNLSLEELEILYNANVIEQLL